MEKFRLILSALAVVALAALPSSAQNKATAMSPDTIKAKVERAQSEGERLIVKLKSGKSISGRVVMDNADSFRVTADHTPFGVGDSSVPVLFSDVESVKGRNPFVKGVKTAGIVTFTVAAVPIVLPTCLISTLFHQPLLCPCTSGSKY
jgi:hypothetical protein